MRTSTAVAVIVVVVIVAGAAWYFLQPSATNNVQTNVTETGSAAEAGTSTSTTTPATNNTVTVLYGANGFSPSTVTIHTGDTVTFVDNGADQMWVASAPHPTHTGYDGTSESVHCAAGYSGPLPFDQCSAGTTFSFTFTKAGTWAYHNHFNSSAHGTVVVQ
jgi:plastocyanin